MGSVKVRSVITHTHTQKKSILKYILNHKCFHLKQKYKTLTFVHSRKTLILTYITTPLKPYVPDTEWCTEAPCQSVDIFRMVQWIKQHVSNFCGHVVLVREGFVVWDGPTANIEHTRCLPAESDHQQHPHNHKLDSHSVRSFCSLVEHWDARTIWHGGPEAKTSGVGVGLESNVIGHSLLELKQVY